MITTSKKSVSLSIDKISSAFGLGALVTAARLIPRSSIHLQTLSSPSMASNCSAANLYYVCLDIWRFFFLFCKFHTFFN
ncbi:hypothetical protein IC582_027437 [Cucumis melo]